jgi:hypothetical protein
LIPAYLAQRRSQRVRKVSAKVQAEARVLVDEEEDDDIYEECREEDTRIEFGENGEPLLVPLGVFSVPKRNRGRYVKKLALIAQAEFGLPSRTEANRLCVQRFLRDFMRTEHVRETHIALILPIAVALSFVPNEGHKYARDVLGTQAVREQVDDLEGRLDGITPGERWTSWFGGTAPAREVKFTK